MKSRAFNKTLVSTLACLSTVFTPITGLARDCMTQPVTTINSKAIWQDGDAVGFKTKKLAVDADGAPNSYQVDGKGLSYTCDGVTATGSTPDTDPNWQAKCHAAWAKAVETKDYSGVRIFGFATGEKNVPIIQGNGDALPGLGYVSTTSVPVADGPKDTQRHYVDATIIPYIVLPGSFLARFHVKPGDIAVLYRPKTQTLAYAVYADGGKLGEGSVKLHQNLGSKPIVKIHGVSRAKAGIEDEVYILTFPGQTTQPTVDAKAWVTEMEAKGQATFQAWGGLERLKVCFK